MTGTLVFPSSVPAAVDYARAATRRGERVVGTSSLIRDEFAGAFPAWSRLPSIHDPEFVPALRELVAQHGLTHVFAPVTSVHAAMAALIDSGEIALRLINDGPVAEQCRQTCDSLARANALHRFMAELLADEVALTRLPPPLRVAAILRQAGLIYGESNDVKLAALLAVAATVPRGDLVEIGTLTGRSASVLVQAAHLFDIGAVLTVDPWALAPAVQNDSPQLVQDMTGVWDFAMLRAGYFVNLLALAGGRLNHLQLTSAAGFAAYDSTLSVETEEFGRTSYAGRVVLLHIDGNHDLDAVRQDWNLWKRRLCPGAWVVFDDYTWMHGRGPRTVGDHVLDEGLWDRSFVCGGALFVRLTGAP